MTASTDREVRELLTEVEQLPAAAVGRARSITWIGPPEHLKELVTRVRREHGQALRQLHDAVRRRLAGTGVGSELGAFLAASELALIECVWGRELEGADRRALRAPWEHLLSA